MKKRVVCLSTSLFIAAAMAMSGCNADKAVSVSLDSADIGAAASATHLIIPEYPAESIRALHHGVAVVAIDLDEKSNVIKTTVLQAPDQEIAESCLKAISSSSFALPSIGVQHLVGHGKLYYYFLLAPMPHVQVPAQL